MSESNEQTENEPEDRYKITIKALSKETLDIISSLLNPSKLFTTEDGLPR